MIEKHIFAQLYTHTGLSEIIAGRVYPVILPQGVTFPAITYQVISDVPESDLDGDSELRNLRVQVNCWSEGYAECKNISAQIRAAMDSAVGFSAIRSGGRDNYEATNHLHYSMMDFSVWTRPGYTTDNLFMDENIDFANTHWDFAN